MSRLGADVRAFAAAVQREFRQIRRYPMFIVGSLFWPILLPSAFVLIGRVYSGNDPRAIAAFAERTGTTNIPGFVFVGFSMYMWLSLFLWGPGTSLRQEQLRGSLESVFLTPASRLVILFGPPVAHAWSVLFQFAVMLAGLRVIFGVELAPDAIARAAVVIAVGIPSMYALASFFSLAVLRFGEVGPLVHFARGTLVLLSGVTFPIALLPGWAQGAASVVPPPYIVSDIRKVLLAGDGFGAVAGDLVIVVVLAAALAGLAVLAYGWIEREARRTGMLGAY